MRRNVIAFLQDSDSRRILLLRKKRPPEWAGLWNGVAGTLREGEDETQGMLRKLEEEVGLKLGPGDIEKRAVIKFGDESELHVFGGFTNVFLAKAVEEEEPIVYPHDACWSREPVVPTCKWIVPLVLYSPRDRVLEVQA